MIQISVILLLRIVALVIVVCASGHSVAWPQPIIAGTPPSPIGEQVFASIKAIMDGTTRTIHGEHLYAKERLLQFYERRAFQPAWICEDGILPHGEALARMIRQARQRRDKPSSYHLAAIEGLVASGRTSNGHGDLAQPHDWIALELLLTDAYFLYAADVLGGVIDPRAVSEVWVGDRPEVDLSTPLERALERENVAEFLSQLRPPHRGYAKLQNALVHYQGIAARGGWPTIADGLGLQKGDSGARVVTLRDRLASTGDLEQPPIREADLFDAALEEALRKFQHRHGLDPDGIVGGSTLTALNVPVQTRVRQIELNMERWRWLPQDLGPRYILVNIGDYTLDVVEQEKSVLTMRVVVGKPSRRTPFFSAEMTYLVINPYWHVPPTIAVQDKLPLIRRDPGYATQQRLKIFREGGSVRVDPRAIDWTSVSPRNFPYRLRQDPGPKNALGRVKFMFPNSHHVYLHDTPARDLFAKTERAFSSGCIRIEKPIELAEYLLQGDPQWSQQKILTTIEKGSEQVVHLPISIPVYLFYWTTWASDEGVVHFRKDIYERDHFLDKALQEAGSTMGGIRKDMTGTNRAS